MRMNTLMSALIVLTATSTACDGVDGTPVTENEASVEFVGPAEDHEEAPVAGATRLEWQQTANGEPAFVQVAPLADDDPCPEGEGPMSGPDQLSQAPQEPEHLSGGLGIHYTQWPQTGFRPYNPSGCNGTTYCVFGPGTKVRWAGTLKTCGNAPWDAYVHDTPCGSGWVRADALN